MSLNLQRQIVQLRKDRDEDRRKIQWLTTQLKTGLQDVIERMIINNFEVEATVKSDDEKIKDLLNG